MKLTRNVKCGIALGLALVASAFCSGHSAWADCYKQRDCPIGSTTPPAGRKCKEALKAIDPGKTGTPGYLRSEHVCGHLFKATFENAGDYSIDTGVECPSGSAIGNTC